MNKSFVAMGIDKHEISVVPETEVFNDGADMGQNMLRSMNGAELE